MWSRRKRALVLPAFLGLGLVTACTGGPPTVGETPGHLRGLEDRVVSARAVVTPGSSWSLIEGVLVVRAVGSLAVFLPAGPEEDLVLTLVPAPSSSPRRIALRVGDRPVGGGPWSLGAAPLTVTVPAGMLGAGRNLLWLDVEASSPADEPELRLAEIRWAFGAAEPRLAAWQTSLARFLEFGLFPVGYDWRVAGTAIIGPGRIRHRFAAAAPGAIGFRLVNDSTREARFVLRLDGRRHRATLAAGTSQPFEVAVGAGQHTLELAADGDPDGVFFWGLPMLKTGNPEHLPTVVLITLDTTRRDAVAPWAPPGRTPRLAELASQSTVFDHAWAVAPWTLPAHASIFTGLYPSHHGAGVWSDGLPEDRVTLAERLREVGYTAVGLAGGRLASFRLGLGQGFAAYRDPPGGEVPADVLTDAALAALEVVGDEPLFLFVNFFDPHTRYRAPAEFQARTGVEDRRHALAGLPIWEQFGEGWSPGVWAAILDGRAGRPPEGLAYLRALYDAEVELMDHHLGRLVDELRRRGRWNDALVVVVGDHGEALGERGRFTHSTWLDPPILEVPLLIKWPGQGAPARVASPVTQVDLYGTILAALGLDASAGDGLRFGPEDLRALVGRSPLLAEEHAARLHQLPAGRKVADHLFALQWSDRREVFWSGGLECETGAPGAWSPARCRGSWPERLAALPSPMQAAAGLAADFDVGDVDPEEAEHLRALGYLE